MEPAQFKQAAEIRITERIREGNGRLLRVLHIASVVHEANRAYCRTIGDDSHLPWTDAPSWQRDSAVRGVEDMLRGYVTSPEQAHMAWSTMKRDNGWVYGPVKDAEAKTHPCLVPYEHLPEEQRLKDRLFFAIVNVFKE